MYCCECSDPSACPPRRLSVPILDGRRASEGKLRSIQQYVSIDEANADKETESDADRFGPFRTLLSLWDNQGTNTERSGNSRNRQGLIWLLNLVVFIICGEGDSAVRVVLRHS